MELLLPLPTDQFFALEEAAYRLSLTVGQLIRRIVSDFLLRLTSVENLECREMDTSARSRRLHHVDLDPEEQ
jgi:hypothetical protein